MRVSKKREKEVLGGRWGEGCPEAWESHCQAERRGTGMVAPEPVCEDRGKEGERETGWRPWGLPAAGLRVCA